MIVRRWIIIASIIHELLTILSKALMKSVLLRCLLEMRLPLVTWSLIFKGIVEILLPIPILLQYTQSIRIHDGAGFLRFDLYLLTYYKYHNEVAKTQSGCVPLLMTISQLIFTIRTVLNESVILTFLYKFIYWPQGANHRGEQTKTEKDEGLVD